MHEENEDNFINQKPLALSEHIHIWRESINLSVKDVASQIGMRPEIILAFEQGDYGIFPARVYAVGYLRRIIDHFSISQSDLFFDAFNTEWEEKRGSTNDSIRVLPHSSRKKWYVTPRRLMSVCGSAGLLFFAWLLVTQLVGFTGAPTLRIDEPGEHAIGLTPLMRVRGSTEKESQLTVNGREITMNGDGAFDEEIELPYGVNVLHFLVQNRFGKSLEQVRYVVVR